MLGLLIAVSGCSLTDPQRPMPGSLTYGKVVYSRYKPGTIVKNTFLDQFGYRSLSDIRFSQMALSNSLIRSRAQIFCGTDSGAAVLPLLFALLDA
ncbi:hypothetical protein Rleg_5784 (plasmid) [Rhizobium leguminosarum bv. trifolii WSM1325]|uniref:Uncharacterized protein n=1 Tax=Rhizobium leguminosarum bv. trifolii (strain WSM1325) TaxID=395491 RepID=C6B842_RHILS|nr:hypothetical protein Rleg_5784 [Rhizobium leguminosarum bv. trifolii WSM1325]